MTGEGAVGLADGAGGGQPRVRGRRVADVRAGRRAGDVAGPCRVPLPVVDGRVPRWAEYVAAAAAGSYDARPGHARGGGHGIRRLRGDRRGGRRDRRRRAAAGEVTNHQAHLPARFSCPVVLVDGGVLPASGAARQAALQRLDALVAQVRAADPAADVVVAGVGDGVSPVRPRAVVAAGPSFPPRAAQSASTRQPGVVQLQDLTATALARVGARGPR